MDSFQIAFDWISLEAQLLVSDPRAAWSEFWVTFGPGGKLHPGYLLAHQYHVAVELCLLIAIVYLLLQRSAPLKRAAEALTEAEVDELVKEWEPEPMVHESAQKTVRVSTPVIDHAVGARCTVDGKENAINLASCNFWGLAGDSEILAKNTAALAFYGVGSCGPRGFYGTIDAHLTLEKRIANFMATEEAIVYSFDIATMPSVLPAFASRKDVIVLEDSASWPLRNGASLSRAQLVTFRRNDMADLEAALQLVVAAGCKKPLNRRFIVVEGVSLHRGDVAPLAEIAALKRKYKFRLAVDETLSFGVLGANGRGAAEAAGLAPRDVEIVTGSLGTGAASAGGFCVGSRVMVDHQRLSGSGYCFSASLPPVLTVGANAAIEAFEARREGILAQVAAAASALRKEVRAVPGLRDLAGDGDGGGSPVVVAVLAARRNSAEEEVAVLAAVREGLLARGAALVELQQPGVLDTEMVQPALRMVATAAHTPEDMAEFGQVLGEVVAEFVR